ncbi:hypothetical protein OH76DRAFT_1480931 [Lentinus brumalis]|uniref:DUF6534 domain-containing protein n=1 Tax=Lentinus brumalis TaxID=2498619 RepID=A0A371DIJ6_9APHY|nr:hypothetical protein OH76DRAFT_1480931 [Polyporus brumalis]
MNATASAPSAVLPPAIPALDDSLGSLLLGAFAGLLLQGMIFLQTYRYFQLYPKDGRLLKAWVWTILILETFCSALNIHTCYYYMVTNYFNPTVLGGNPVWSLKILIVPACLSAIVAEAFFARRVWLVGPQYRPLVVIAVTLELGFLACFLLILRRWNAPTTAEYLQDYWLPALGSGFIGIGDIMMTAVLSHVLHNSRTGIKRTNWTIDVLIRYTLTTGLLICIFEVINIILSVLFPSKLIFIPISIILTKISANSFLAALNTRNWLATTDAPGTDPLNPFTTSLVGPANGPSRLASTLRFKTKLSEMTSAGSAQTEAIELGDISRAEQGRSADVLEIKHDPEAAMSVERSLAP